MVRLKQLLLEAAEPQISISIEDIQKVTASSWGDRDAKITLGVLEDFYFDDDPEKRQYAVEYLELLNRVLQHVLKIVESLKVPHVNLNYIKSSIIEQHEFRSKEDDFFPFPLYVAANQTPDGDWAEVGIMVDQHGKVLEIHEGNDEATPETVQLVNKMVNPSGKKVRIYGHHSTKLCQKIEETGYLPANLYVSPKRGLSPNWGHAGDFGEDRSMFTGIININDVSQEDEVAWKTIGITKIERFQWL